MTSPEDVERFRAIVTALFGWRFDEARASTTLAEVLRRRVEATGSGSADGYLRRLGAAPWVDEQRAVAEELTITETYFFRNPDQFRAFDEVALLPHKLTRGTPLRVLSAGCASGEEAYTLAILVYERTGEAASGSIRAVDVNPGMLAKAERGRYSAWSLRETPPEMQRRWFSMEGREAVLDPRLRSLVKFELKNLAEDNLALFQPRSYDVVFCRNVLMYFSEHAARRLVARIAQSLSPRGLLFLGHAETLRGLSHDFHLRHTHGTFYYEKRGDAEAVRRDAEVVEATGHTPGCILPAADASWVETIRQASERIQALSCGASRNGAVPARTLDAAPSAQEPLLRPAWNVGFAIELLKNERFSEVRALLGALPPESARDPEVLLFSAVLLTHGGDLAEAERACERLLEIDEMSAGAHYLMALCLEERGDRSGALDHDQVAAYLDPGFAMPRLHLGLLARRAGERDAARQELGQALALLDREDSSRLVLFGGGFTREGLVALCRAELLACGGGS
jgi:chemotaxis protein methyltransferase CheR